VFTVAHCKPLIAFALPLLACVANPAQTSGAVDGRVVQMVQPRLEAENVLGPDAEPGVTAGPQAAAISSEYPFYMPMQQLRRPAMVLNVRCDASRAAGKEVYSGRDAAAYYGRSDGGIEIIYEARDGAGNPCVYPFAPAMPQTTGDLNGTQYIIRSSEPGHRAVFRTSDQWATINLRMFDLGRQRVHFEMRDIELDFPGAVQARGALHLEVVGSQAPGLFTAVVRRSKIFGGKNGIFVPGGQTMLYIEDSDIAGNVGGNVDQEHSTYINGILVSHFRNSVWRGQLAWKNIASGHQLKDKAYLRIYEDLIVSNQPSGETASAMPLVDISAFGFTWSNNLQLRRFEPAQAPRDALVDLRTEIMYGQQDQYPWDIMVNRGWQMPADPLSVLDQVYLSVFMNTKVESFRDEPYAFALRPQGTNLVQGSNTVEGNERTTRAQQRLVSIAFNTSGHVRRAYSNEGWTFSNPQLAPGDEWVKDRDLFIRHALGLIGR